MSSIGVDDIVAASARIFGHVKQTPLKLSAALSDLANVPVYLKLENQQTTGSFKLRGATNAVLSLTDDERQRGVVTASTGNHGRALAHAAQGQNIRAVVCMSALVPANKVNAVRELGAEVHIIGRSQDDAQVEVERLVLEDGLTAIPPFDHRAIIAGQGTLGLEIADQCRDVELVLVPLSGGGLASGVAAAIKARCPQARVIGVSMERGAAMNASLNAGQPTNVEELETLADSLGGGIGLHNRYTFAMCRDLLDGVVLLTEAEIAAGVRYAFTAEGQILEGAGAVGIAALLAGKVALRGPIVIVASGGNIDPQLHAQIVAAADNRAGAF